MNKREKKILEQAQKHIDKQTQTNKESEGIFVPYSGCKVLFSCENGCLLQTNFGLTSIIFSNLENKFNVETLGKTIYEEE